MTVNDAYMTQILECIRTAIEIIDATPHSVGVENRISLACASGKLEFVHMFLSEKMA